MLLAIDCGNTQTVFGLFDGRDAAEPRVDRPQPGELALGGRLEVARTPDDPAFVLDVPHAPLRLGREAPRSRPPSASTLARAPDTPAKLFA